MFTARTAIVTQSHVCFVAVQQLYLQQNTFSEQWYVQGQGERRLYGAAIHWQVLTNWILLEKLTVPQLVTVLSACYVTRMFITEFTGIRHFFLSWSFLIHSTLSHFIRALPCPLLQQTTKRAAVVAFWQCRQATWPLTFKNRASYI